MREDRTFAVELMLDSLKGNHMPLDAVHTSDLVELIELCNAKYRSGEPVVSDDFYDHALLAELRRREPDHEWFAEVEPEPVPVEGKTVKLPVRMLSTNKAYTLAEIEKWANDVVKVGLSLGLPESDILFRVTPKLDGFAAYDDGTTLYTRGDGYSGTDITRAFERGLLVSGLGTRGQGPGEIVVYKKYFEDELADSFENTRNVIASVIKEGNLDVKIATAIRSGGVVFMPFSVLGGGIFTKLGILKQLDDLWTFENNSSSFDTDGLVIEAIHEGIKQAMGHTNHHHRWQIAYKKNTEFHDIEVEGLQWQTAKSGRITPVVLLKPTKVSGVTISKATGHHAGNVIQNRIDWGAIVRVCRSGQVIPYIESVIKPAGSVGYPNNCPSCVAPTELVGDNLMCTNTFDCPAQIERTIEHFFKTIGNCDGFGPAVIEKICATGLQAIDDVYQMGPVAFKYAGFGEKTAYNLYRELEASLSRPIEDWRFLAAFGLPGVGKGGCERLLKHHALHDVFGLTADEIVRIDGFAEKTAKNLVESLARIKPQFDALVNSFTLTETLRGRTANSPISGKTLVFTGTMQNGNRDAMEKQAKALGAEVSGSVSSKTDYLVCGENVGKAKTDAAAKHGVEVLFENDYLALIAGI
jgi:DNA ligase (NAD+)